MTQRYREHRQHHLKSDRRHDAARPTLHQTPSQACRSQTTSRLSTPEIVAPVGLPPRRCARQTIYFTMGRHVGEQDDGLPPLA